ncbi:MAG: GAF domain-containing sensor histidine kinase [Chloroflexota bacterium]
MDEHTIDGFIEINEAISQAGDWKQALNKAIVVLRKIFIFDNIAIYRRDPSGLIEVVYARAVGRGLAAEADAAWGEEIAGQAISTRKMVLKEPHDRTSTDDRLINAHLLGLPLLIEGDPYGALVFIRFGGPVFTRDQSSIARLAGQLFAQLIHRNLILDRMEHLKGLEQQMRLQEDFVATVSHDLRTPLGFIKGYTTTLLRSDTDWDPDTQREFLTIIDEETDRLAELIENVLESARLQSQTLRMDFRPVRLDALVREVAVRAQTHYRSLRVKLDLEEGPAIDADNVRLAQVFENLFSNTIKYAPGAPIQITLNYKDDCAAISFGDNGPGIDGDFLPFIFERFYRVPGQASGTGTGLGLFICKQIVQAHHGKIWAESELGEGTRFFIEIPVSQA